MCQIFFAIFAAGIVGMCLNAYSDAKARKRREKREEEDKKLTEEQRRWRNTDWE